MRELDDLRERGYSIIGVMPAPMLAQMNRWLHNGVVYLDAHVPQTARNRGACVVPMKDADGVECFCAPTADAILAPHLIDTALTLTDIAAAYLGRDPPVMYSANVFWTRPGTAPLRNDIQAFHVDSDDTKFLAMFVYLTDVLTDEDGPQDLHGPDGVVRTIFGHAGTIFLADTSRLHRGRKPTSHLRGIAWVRWGVSDHPPAGVWDKIEPVSEQECWVWYPDDPRLQESIKLLVRE